MPLIAQRETAPLPASIAALNSMRDQVKPITNDERRARIQKAKRLMTEEKIGALEPGKWADFIIIDRDPTKVDAQRLARTQVLETWVAGRKVWSRGAIASPAERGR